MYSTFAILSALRKMETHTIVAIEHQVLKFEAEGGIKVLCEGVVQIMI